MKILFIANGNLEKDININTKEFNIICCIDGGLNNLVKINRNIAPDYIFGDFDSIDKNLLNLYSNKSKIIKKETQDISDLLFGVNYILNNYNNITEMDFIGMTGDRIDHTICNIILLDKIPVNIKTKVITTNEEIYLIKNSLKLADVLHKTISIIPLSDIENINTNGLKWEIKNKNLKFNFIDGISNIALKNEIYVSIKSGKLLMIVNKNVS